MSKCLECGDIATEGSIKYPYCKQCFDFLWKNTPEFIIWIAEKAKENDKF